MLKFYRHGYLYISSFVDFIEDFNKNIEVLFCRHFTEIHRIRDATRGRQRRPATTRRVSYRKTSSRRVGYLVGTLISICRYLFILDNDVSITDRIDFIFIVIPMYPRYISKHNDMIIIVI